MKNLTKLIGLVALLGLTACGSDTEFIYKEGPRGEDGYNSLIDMSRGEFESCNGTLINSGLDLNRNEVLDIDEIEKTSFVCDGSNGVDGRDGIDGIDGIDGNVLTVLDPCGDGAGHDELILVLDGDIYLAWLKNVGIVELQEGVRYRTTDRQKCHFELDNGELVYN